MKRVVIVGAGVVGLWCAVRLAKAGARVTVAEAESSDLDVWAPGASATAAGMLAPLDHRAGPHDALAFESLDLWRSAQSDSEWADGVRFGGGVLIAKDGEEAAAIQQHARLCGRRAEPLSHGGLRKRTGFDAKLDHALFVEDEGVADPIRVMGGLYMQARAHGVSFAYGRDVCEVGPNRVATPEGDMFEADAVVLAPGVWANEALVRAAPVLARVQPAKGHLAPVRLPAPFDANLRTPNFYLARRRDDAVLGSTMEPGVYDRRVDSVRVAALEAAANALLLGAVKPAGRAWTGLRPMSPDGWPMIGDGGAGVFVAAGHSRNGWLLAPLTAEIVTAYVFDQAIAPGWAALAPQRF